MLVAQDRRYVNRLADIYLDKLVNESEADAKDWLFRTCMKDFDLLGAVDKAIPTRAQVKGVGIK